MCVGELHGGFCAGGYPNPHPFHIKYTYLNLPLKSPKRKFSEEENWPVFQGKLVRKNGA